jgi:hypothetical protein
LIAETSSERNDDSPYEPIVELNLLDRLSASDQPSHNEANEASKTSCLAAAQDDLMGHIDQTGSERMSRIEQTKTDPHVMQGEANDAVRTSSVEASILRNTDLVELSGRLLTDCDAEHRKSVSENLVDLLDQRFTEEVMQCQHDNSKSPAQLTEERGAVDTMQPMGSRDTSTNRYSLASIIFC